MPALTQSGPGSVDTVTELLRQRAERQPDSTAFTFLLDGDARAASLTYAELDRRARAIAVALRQRVRRGRPGPRGV